MVVKGIILAGVIVVLVGMGDFFYWYGRSPVWYCGHFGWRKGSWLFGLGIILDSMCVVLAVVVWYEGIDGLSRGRNDHYEGTSTWFGG